MYQPSQTKSIAPTRRDASRIARSTGGSKSDVVLIGVGSRNGVFKFPATTGKSEETFRLRIAQALRSLTLDSILTQKDMAFACDRKKSQVSEYLETGRIPAEQYRAIAQEAARRGDLSLYTLILPEGYRIVPCEADAPDGVIDDNISLAVEHMGLTRRDFVQHKKSAALRDVERLKRDIATLEVEVIRQ